MCAQGVMLMFLLSQNRIDVDADVIALVDKKIDVESWPWGLPVEKLTLDTSDHCWWLEMGDGKVSLRKKTSSKMRVAPWETCL